MTKERLSRRSEFTPIPSHSSTFVTWYHHRMSYRRESPRLMYRGENFTPVRNLATVSCNAKRQRNDHTFRCEFCLPVDWNGKLMRNVCDFESRVYFYQHEVYLQITRYEMTQSSCKRYPKSKSYPGMKLTPVRVFSYKHPPISFLGCIQRKAPNFRINNRQKFNTAKYHFFLFLRQCMRILAMK